MKRLLLALVLLLVSAPAYAVCPTINDYPFEPNCPVSAAELNKALGGSGNITAPVDYDPLCGGQTTEAEIALTPPTAHDCTDAINLAASTLVNGERAQVRLQTGRYYITDSILLDGSQKLVGDGRGSSIIRCRDTFNPAATGITVLGNTNLGLQGAGETLEDLAIFCDQPDTPTGGRAGAALLGVCDSRPTGTICKYPPAVLMTGSGGRHYFRNVRIQKVWDGIAGDAVRTTNSPIQDVTGAADNGSGLIRLTVASTAAFGTSAGVANVGGVPNATGRWTITVVDATHIDLVGSTFAGAFTSGGTVNPRTGNQGYHLRDVEMSSLNKGVWIDGVKDQSTIMGFQHIGFGIPGPNSATPGLHNVMADGNTDCINFGDQDGSGLVNVVCHKVAIRLVASLTNPGDALGAGRWTNVTLDGGSFIVEDVNNLSVTDMVISGSGPYDPCLLNVQGGGGMVFTSFLVTNAANKTPVCVSGGELNLNGSRFINNANFETPMVDVSGGTTRIKGTHFGAYTGSPTNRTEPLIRQSGGVLVMTNNTAAGPTTETGTFLEVGTDLNGHWFSDNKLSGWPISLGCGPTTAGYCFTTMNGFYDFPDVPITIPTVTATFATNGDFVPANIVQDGVYWLRGDFAEYKLSFEFDTNAYTTSANDLILTTNMPTHLMNGISSGCVLGRMDMVVVATTPRCRVLGGPPPNTEFRFRRNVSGGAEVGLGVTAFPASVVDYRLDMFGRYQIR